MRFSVVNCLKLTSVRDQRLRDCIHSCRSLVTRLRLLDPFQADETQQVSNSMTLSEHNSGFSKCSGPSSSVVLNRSCTSGCMNCCKSTDK
jgi:hypothetical protein